MCLCVCKEVSRTNILIGKGWTAIAALQPQRYDITTQTHSMLTDVTIYSPKVLVKCINCLPQSPKFIAKSFCQQDKKDQINP